MSRKSRIEYLIETMCVFITGFIIFGTIAAAFQAINGSRLLSFLAYGSFGGFAYSIILSGIILAVNFFAKRSMKFRITASVLWFFTLAAILYVGILTYIPYQIYNIVKIIKDKQ